MAEAAVSAKQFPFFDLPQELRDMVYDNLKRSYYADRLHYPIYDSDEATVESVVPSARLISHRFSQELYEKDGRDRTLVLPYCPEIRYVPLDLYPKISDAITKINMTMLAHRSYGRSCNFWCATSEEIPDVRKGMAALIPKLPNLKSINACINVEWPEHGGQNWPDCSPHPVKSQHELDEFVKMRCINFGACSV